MHNLLKIANVVIIHCKSELENKNRIFKSEDIWKILTNHVFNISQKMAIKFRKETLKNTATKLKYVIKIRN